MPRFEMVDMANIPTFYIDTAIPEDAGNGNVRVWCCVTRRGLLIPQYEVVMHSSRLILAAKAVTDFAEEIFKNEIPATLLSMAH
jgi:hypothetical protein